MDLHIGYESAPPAKLKQIDGADEKVRSAGLSPNLFSKPTSTKKKPKDPTICEKFKTYRSADYKGKVIDLLMRVTTVSVRTVAVTSAMRKTPR